MYFSPLAKQNQAEVGPKSCIMWFWIVGIVNVVVAWIYKSCYTNILLFAKRNKTEDFWGSLIGLMRSKLKDLGHLCLW